MKGRYILLCLNCLNWSSKNSLVCKSCNSLEILVKFKNIYILKGQAYKRSDFEEIMVDYRTFNKKEIKLRKLSFSPHSTFLKEMYLNNITRSTKTRLILPLFLILGIILLITLASVILYTNGNLGLDGDLQSMVIFSWFIGLFLLVIFIINSKRVFIDKLKLFKRPFKKRIKYLNVSKQLFEEKMSIFDSNIFKKENQ